MDRNHRQRCLLDRGLDVGESAQFVRLLHQSGFSAEEIAESMNAPLDIIRDILGSTGDDASQAA